MSPPDEAEFRPSDAEQNEFRSTKDASLQRLEAELAALTPRALKLDRDRAMFLAGQASVGLPPSRRPWAWPTAFSTMTALAASLLVVIAMRPPVQIVNKIVRVPVEVVAKTGVVEQANEEHTGELDESLRPAIPPVVAERHPPTSAGAMEAGYLSLRDRVLAMGIDSWQLQPRPSGEQSGSQPANYHDLLNSLLSEG